MAVPALGHLQTMGLVRGCLQDTWATFAPARVHSSSPSWLYLCLHDTTTKCHAGVSHPGVSSLVRGCLQHKREFHSRTKSSNGIT